MTGSIVGVVRAPRLDATALTLSEGVRSDSLGVVVMAPAGFDGMCVLLDS